MASGKDCSGTRHFGDVKVHWHCDAITESCHVDVWWRDSLIVSTQLDAEHRTRVFSVVGERTPRRRVSGEFRYDPIGCELYLLHLEHAHGKVHDVRLCPDHPTPPIPIPDPATEREAALVGDAGGDLFPFIFLQGWPAISAQDRRDRFVPYDSLCAPGEVKLICRLREIRETDPDPRPAMIAEGRTFIAHLPPYEPPYREQQIRRYADSPDRLRSPMKWLWSFSVELWSEPAANIGAFVMRLCQHLDAKSHARWHWNEIVAWVESAAFALQLDRAWQSVFALNVVLGYDRNGLERMVRTVGLAHLLRRMVGSMQLGTEGRPAELPWPPPSVWTAQRIADGVMATLILPAPVFPLPPRVHAAAANDARVGSASAVLPYALGELRLVKRRLLRYEPGEVSHIENVMAGEHKRSTQRDRTLERTASVEVQRSVDTQDNSLGGVAGAFDAQARQTLREAFDLKYDTNYGPPQEAKQSGSWKLEPLGEDPTQDTVAANTELGQQITMLAARRCAQSVIATRGRESVRDSTRTVVRAFDRRHAETNLRGIYRWVNAVYECWTTRYGRRLILEFFLDRPAASYIAAERHFAGLSLSEPQPPGSFGVHTFEDLSLDPLSPAYYAKLAAIYGVDDAEPPPELRQSATVAFVAGEPLRTQNIALSVDYEAASACLSLVSPDAPLQATVLIGATKIPVDSATTEPVPVPLAGQRGVLAVSMNLKETASVDSKALVATGVPAIPTNYSLSVEIASRPSAGLMGRWKSALYSRIMTAYRTQTRAYLDAAQAHAGPNSSANALAARAIVRGELKRGGLRAFLAPMAERTGEIGREFRFLPAIVAFLDSALEWSEMTYSMVDDLESDGQTLVRRVPGEDEPLTAFLQAAHARVLLPVAPGFEHTLLYFLASGMIWSAADLLAPTFAVAVDDRHEQRTGGATYVDLVNDLKQSRMRPLDTATVTDKPWPVVLPTTMVVLQEDDKLPWAQR